MKIAPCTAADIAELTDLFIEMEEYYFEKDVVSYQQMHSFIKDKVFSSYSGVTLIGARSQGELVGFATFTLMYPGPLCTGQAYMKELFVSERARGQGAGKSLIKFIAALAVEQGCSRLDWTAEKSNPNAGKFYLSLGAALLEDKQYFRLSDQTLHQFAQQD